MNLTARDAARIYRKISRRIARIRKPQPAWHPIFQGSRAEVILRREQDRIFGALDAAARVEFRMLMKWQRSGTPDVRTSLSEDRAMRAYESAMLAGAR